MFERRSVVSLPSHKELVVRAFARGINDNDLLFKKFRFHGIIGNLHGKTPVTGPGGYRDPGFNIWIKIFLRFAAKFRQLIPGDERDAGDERVRIGGVLRQIRRCTRHLQMKRPLREPFLPDRYPTKWDRPNMSEQ